MKKYLMYLAIAVLVIVVAFFAYKKIYGGNFFAAKETPNQAIPPIGNKETSPMFGE